MRLNRLIATVLLLTIPAVGLRSQKLSKDEREILWLQDQRSLGDGSLFNYLEHKESNVRRRAVVALGNIQDTSAIDPLLPLLEDKTRSVRAAAAFALGQIGSSRSETALSERLRRETDESPIVQLLQALGKSGTAKSLDDIVAFGLPKKMLPLKGDQVLSIARFGLRNIKSERSIWFCFDALEEDNPRIRWIALYALWRSAPHGLIDVELSKRKESLQKLCSDKSPDVRMHLATLLGKTRSEEAMDLLALLKKNDMKKRDWRVQVNIAKSFAALAPREEAALDQLLSYLDVENDHVRVVTLQSLANLASTVVKKLEHPEEVQKKILGLIKPSEKRSETVQGEALVALAKHFPGEFDYAAMLKDPKISNRMKSKVVEALSYQSNPASFQIVLDQLENDSVRVAMAAWDFVKRFFSPANLRILQKDTSVTNDLVSKLYRKIKVSLLREDMAITTLVANALSDSSLYSILKMDGYGERVVEEVMLAYGKLTSPNDVEAMQAVLETLGKIGDERTVPLLERALSDPDRTVAMSAAAALTKINGTDYSDRLPQSSKPLFTDYDWNTMELLPKNQKVEIKTAKGTIRIELLKEHAPFTVLSYFRLIRKRFFDNLMFHRVVPNFVAQGGDPRGDGWGGPNYALRTEYSVIGYDRGAVGVASAGKDTEGCQFFITHSSQPHLDGRYTIFARVVSGMDVVDRIQIGDRIRSMRLLQ